MSQPTLLSLHNVFYKIGVKSLVDDINFDLKSEEFLTIIGPNGAGKTTLLKLIIGLLKPTSGEIKHAADVKIGYMPQKLRIDYMLPLTANDFLQDSQDISYRHVIIKHLGLQNLLESSMHSLSGGEFQRVLLARALLNKPTLLILDEPSQGVDIHGQNELFNLLAQLRQKMKFAILMVSHDLHVVHKESDRVICLNHHICCMGKPDVIRQTKEYQSMFPHHLTEHLRPYTHHHDHRHDQLEKLEELNHE